ncbi:MAG: hypothetical protein HOD63_01425 [Bacteroidetes bacterium]|nr:hypothetical protein [Bacteroidota bacterium]MBT5528716.1 hypothetical protein [Cytophagia bacterium]MBT3422484.1 hypothetical protein [Bacteroidota bacterium]MBT3800317.1 hypothetical protein [Bacteroidota bacterium]MBT3935714.1 hypothetical protein [Bacteroidota bacterium]
MEIINNIVVLLQVSNGSVKANPLFSLLPFIIIVIVPVIVILSTKRNKQNLIINGQTFLLAPWYLRLLSFFIDIVISVTLGTIISSTFFQETNHTINVVFYLVYCFIFESFTGQTIGKLILQLQVIDSQTGYRISFQKVALRTLCRLIPFDAIFYLNYYPKGLHDTLPKTFIILKIKP